MVLVNILLIAVRITINRITDHVIDQWTVAGGVLSIARLAFDNDESRSRQRLHASSDLLTGNSAQLVINVPGENRNYHEYRVKRETGDELNGSIFTDTPFTLQFLFLVFRDDPLLSQW